MKRIIIISMMFLSIYCTLESCLKEEDPSQCRKHSIEPPRGNYFSCFKYESYFGNDMPCIDYLADEKLQKIYYKYDVGYTKEWGSSNPTPNSINHPISTIFYVEGDTVKEEYVSIRDILTEEEKEIYFGKNTCWYRAYARFRDEYEGERYINISDKNICYNVDRFEDLKDILDCGYATIKGKYNNKSFVFTSCCHILDNNADELFKKYYNYFVL